MNNIIWTKDHCFYCMMAKQTLDNLSVPYEERNISSGEWTKEQLSEAVPSFKTYPQIFLNGKHIGGFDDLRTYIEDTGFNGTGHTL